MDYDFDKSKLTPALTAMRGVAGAAIALPVKGIMNLIVLLLSSTESGFLKGIPNQLTFAILFAASLFLFSSVFGAFSKYDVRGLAKYSEKRGDSTLPLKGRLKYVLSDKAFYIEAVTYSAITAVAAGAGLSPEIFGIFHTGDGLSPYSSGVFPFLITLALVFLISLTKRSDTLRYFDKLIKDNEEFKIEGNVKLLLRLGVICILYPVCGPMIPLLPFMVISIGGVIAALAVAIGTGGMIGTVLFIVSAVYLLIFTFKALKRKRLIAKIDRESARADLRFCELKNPYVSLIIRRKFMRFTLEDGKRKYKVLVISPLRKSFPIYFTSGNEAYHEVKIGMKHAHFSLLRFYFPYENEGDGTGILLIAPDPESVYVTEGDKSRRIFNADKLYDNVAYDSDAFFGALSRGCLGKYDGMKKQ